MTRKPGWKSSATLHNAGAIGAITVILSTALSDTVKIVSVVCVTAIACMYAATNAIAKLAEPAASLVSFLWTFRRSQPLSGTPSTDAPKKD